MDRLFFDDEKIYDGFSKRLKDRLDEYTLWNDSEDITVLSPDDVDFSQTSFPCVTFELFGQRTEPIATDYEEIEYYSYFSVEVDIYTTNANKYRNALAISNEIVKLFQEKMVVGGYYSRGLIVEQKERVMSPNDELCRFIVRMSGKADNRNKLILPR